MESKPFFLNITRALFIALACTMTQLNAEEPYEQQESEKPLTAVEIKMQQRISIAFDNEPIDRVLLALADQADIDIVKSPDVSGVVTAVLTDVPVGEALEQILSAQGFGFVPSENMIRVVPKKDMVNIQEPTVSKVYRVTYANVKEVEAALKKFVSKDGSLSSNPGTSNIIVTDKESKIKAVDDFINEIDRVTPQVLVEVRIYDITSTDLLDLGVSWFIGSNSVLGDALGTGSDGNQGTQSGKTQPFSRGILDTTTNLNPTTNNTIRFGVLNSSVNIDVLLRAEQLEASAELLANPRILVLDNEDAMFKSIREIPYRELTQTSGGGQISSTEFREVGVELKVTPHVTRDGMIRLRVQPQFSIEVPSANVSAGDITIEELLPPTIDSRQADTTLLVQDGQTIVLGGLRKKDALKEHNKVPLLGDLPLLGALFSFNGEKMIVNELIVFITPHVINTPVMTDYESCKYKDTYVPAPKPVKSKLLEIRKATDKMKAEEEIKKGQCTEQEQPCPEDNPKQNPSASFRKAS